MARNSMDLTSFVGKLLKEDDSDILREGIRSLAQMIMEVADAAITRLHFQRSRWKERAPFRKLAECEIVSTVCSDDRVVDPA